MAQDNQAPTMSDQLLVECGSLEYLQAPVKKATRLKYNCVSVSPRLVALGSNTGGIYLFSRSDEKLIQIAFAEKETNPVVMVQLSPNEKFVGFVSSTGTIHVLELRLETKAKPETLRSTSDLGVATVTHLYWDPASTRLYVGDDQGRVSMIPVSSNKAKNLFSAPLEVILRLDSTIIQIDKSEERLLVSTLTRCYLCNTLKQTYTQIGKKLRDGQYGACFLSQGSDSPMIYCARPGSRIWEVDLSASVLNTHQFKQLLAVPPTSVFRPDGEYPGLPAGTFPSQAVNFPKLKVFGSNYLLSWNQSTMFVLDPINVKVILWSKHYSGIIDIVCQGRDIYICLQTMELVHISIQPVSEVVSLCLRADNQVAAANLCLTYRGVLHHKHVRKKLGPAELEQIYDRLMEAEMYKLAERFQELIHEVEDKVALEAETYSSGSNRSRSSSVISSLSGNEPQKANRVDSDETAFVGTVSSESAQFATDGKETKYISETNVTNVVKNSNNYETGGFMNVSLHVRDVGQEGRNVNVAIETETDEQDFVGASPGIVSMGYDNSDYRNHTTGDGFIDQIKEKKQIDSNSELPVDLLINGEIGKDDEINQDLLNTSYQKSYVQSDSIKTGSSDVDTSEPVDVTVRDTRTTKQPLKLEDTMDSISLDESSRDSGISEPPPADRDSGVGLADRPAGLLQVPGSGRQSASPAPSLHELESSNNFEEELDEDDVGDLNIKLRYLGSRRSSLTSLSSFDSAEVTLDQLQAKPESAHGNEPIAVSVRRKSAGKKKTRRRVSLEEQEGKTKTKNVALSPTGSLQEPIAEQQQLSVSQGTSTSEGPAGTLQSQEDLYRNKEQQLYAEKNADSISLNSVLSTSGEFGHSGGVEMVKTEELSQSLDCSPTGSPLMESWESGSLEKTGSSFPSTSKAKFLKMKDRMQTKMTSKTKNLIRNIKEKNLLSKAKELAENLAQPNDRFLFGEGLYVEPLDTHTTNFDVENKSTGSFEQSFDETDSIAQCLVDIAKLQEKTEETQAKLQDISLLMNPKAVQMTLLEWVTVLNKTFQELHVKMYTQSSTDENNKGTDKVNESSASEANKTCDTNSKGGEKVVGIESATECAGEAQDQASPSVDTACVEDSYGSSILRDNEFCYIKDPLHLQPQLFKDVCELVQACFDIGTHGEILNYQNLNYCPVSSSSTVNGGSPGCKDERIVGVAETMQSSNCDTSNLNSSKDGNDSSTIASQAICDKLSGATSAIVSSTNTCKSDSVDEESDETVKIKQGEHTSDEQEDIFTDFDDQPPDDLFESLGIWATTKTEDRAGNRDVANINETTVGDEPDSDESEEATDCAMGFFVRCYFPYLSLAKVREKLLTDQHLFHTWQAFVSCLQVLVINDSDKYGIQKGTVIVHLLETHYHSDNSSLLLGHISKLVQTSDPTTVVTCVKCHPYIQPVDVLYMCRLHGVAMETVFQQYMMQMVQQASRALRSDTEAALYSHMEVRCAWLELLLAEEDNWTALKNDNDKPCLFSHKHQWKNQLCIETVLCVSTTTIEAKRLLNICTKFGYWRGALRLTKQLGHSTAQLDIILHLGDLDLISSYSDLGYLPHTTEEWESLFTACMAVHDSSAPQQHDPSVQAATLTVRSLSLLLVRYLGPAATLALLDRLAVPEGALTPEFYQSCLVAGMVHKHQRCVLHSMLEKVDSYLWSQRPATLSPQLHYLAVQEKDMSKSDSDSRQQDKVQTLSRQLKERADTDPYLEDPECHWGVETRINLLCPCCNIALKEPVSHEEPGVLLFRCGHGYHKMCLPERVCLLCVQ